MSTEVIKAEQIGNLAGRQELLEKRLEDISKSIDNRFDRFEDRIIATMQKNNDDLINEIRTKGDKEDVEQLRKRVFLLERQQNATDKEQAVSKTKMATYIGVAIFLGGLAMNVLYQVSGELINSAFN